MQETDVRAVLLLTCPDQPGLVAAVSDFIARHKGNIVHADQHTDFEQGLFVQRVEWQLAGFSVPRPELDAAFRPIAERFKMSWTIRFSDHKPKAAIFVTRQAHCLYDLLARRRMGELNADFPLVVSNHEELGGVAREFGLDYRHFPVAAGGKTAQEQRVLRELEERGIELIILARYMQVLSADFVSRFSSRVINIHHSFLPAFAGAKPYHQAHERGVKLVGATAHYVTTDLDQGPIIEQGVVRVSHRDAVPDIVRKGRDLEKVVLSRAVQLHLANRVVVYGNKTVVFD